MADKATSGDVLNPVSDDKWMTPVRTKEMVEKVIKDDVFPGNTTKIIQESPLIIPILDAKYDNINDIFADGTPQRMNTMKFNGFNISYSANLTASSAICYDKTKIYKVFSFYGLVTSGMSCFVAQNPNNTNTYFYLMFTANNSSTTISLYKFTPTATNPTAEQTFLGSVASVNMTSVTYCPNLIVTDTHVYFIYSKGNTNSINIYAFPINGGSPSLYISSSLSAYRTTILARAYLVGGIIYIYTYSSVSGSQALFYNIMFTISTSTFGLINIGTGAAHSYQSNNPQVYATDNRIFALVSSATSSNASSTTGWNIRLLYLYPGSSSFNHIVEFNSIGTSIGYAVDIIKLDEDRILLERYDNSSYIATRYICDTSYSVVSFADVKTYGLRLLSNANIVSGWKNGILYLMNINSNNTSALAYIPLNGDPIKYLAPSPVGIVANIMSLIDDGTVITWSSTINNKFTALYDLNAVELIGRDK